MHPHPSRTYLYKRVKLLTNLGEHDAAQALFADLQARQRQDATPNRHSSDLHAVACQSRAQEEAGGGPT